MGNKPKKLALRVVVIYAIVGFLWIIVSQKLAAGLVNGKRLLLQIDMYADWAFVSITAILSFFLLKRDYELLEKNTRQRVAAENEALKSENRYRKLFSVGKDAIFVVDQETGRFLDANPAAEKMYGYSHEEFLNLGPVGLSTDPEATKLLLEQEEEYISNRLHRRKDGTVFHVEITSSVYSQDGKKYRVASVRDVTERQKADEKLRLHEALLQRVVDLVPHPIFAKDRNGRYLFVNRCFAESLGVNPDQGMGTAPFSFPCSSLPAEPLSTEEVEVLENEQLKVVAEQVCLDPKGRSRVLHTVKTPFLPPGSAEPALLGVSFDITDIKENEAKLRKDEEVRQLFFEHAPAALAMFDREMRYLYVSRRWMTDFKLGPENPRGKSHYDFFPLVKKEWKESHQRALLGEVCRSLSDLYVGVDGVEQWLRWEVRPWFELDGNIGGIVVFAEDITALHLAETQLREREESLQLLGDSFPGGFIYQLVKEPGMKTRFRHISRGVERLTGVQSSAILANPEALYDLVVTEDRRMLAELMQESENKLSIFDAEFRLKNQASQVVWLQLRSTPQRSADGVVVWHGIAMDITQSKTEELREVGRRRTLEMVAKGAPLAQVLQSIVEIVEGEHEDWLCSILLMHEDQNSLLHFSGPKLPDWYNQAIHGIKIGENVGSCGAAAYLGQPMIVEDVLTHPNWEKFRHLAIRAGLRACWSYPINSSEGKVLGTFAVYHRQAVSPNTGEHQFLLNKASIAAISIERKYLDESLLRNQMELSQAMELGQIARWERNVETGLFKFNDRFYQLYATTAEREGGYIMSPDEYTERFLLPGDEDLITRGTKDSLALPDDESVRRTEHKMVRRDGKIRIMSVSISTERTPAGSIVGLHGVNQDITERREAEEALRENEARLSTIFKASPMGILITRLQDGLILDANEAFAKIIGFNLQEIIGSTTIKLGIWSNPDLREEALRKIVEGGAYKDKEIQVRNKNGEPLDMLISIERVVLEGEHCSLSMVVDITQRKKSEKERLEGEMRFRHLAENIAEVFWLTDTEKNEMLYVSPAYESVWGRPNKSLYEDPASWIRTIHPEDRDRIIQALPKQTEGHYDQEYRVIRPDGSIRYIRDKAFPVRDEAGKVFRLAGVAMDITAQKTSEAESKKLEMRLRQAQKMEAIGTLAGGIAHDFNNMLAVIFGYISLLEQDTEGNIGAQESLAEIMKASNRAKDLVQQILTFSRQHEQKRQVLALGLIVKEVAKFLRSSIPAEVRIDLNLDSEIPKVLADPTQIHQTVMNLVTNSLHAMSGRSGVISITLGKFRADSQFIRIHPDFREVDYVCLSISDNGHGMEPSTLERIFDPFFTTKPVGQGTGLGLAVVHGIVKSNEGAILVKSQPGVGTTFDLYFPAHLEAVHSPDMESLDVPRGQRQRILVVDDEPELAKITGKLLERLNYVPTVITTAADALALFREDARAFSLVLTDLSMPEMTGLELAESMLDMAPDTPIVLVSGYNAAQNTGRLYESGIAEVLDKPVSVEALAKVIHKIMTMGAGNGSGGKREKWDEKHIVGG